MSGGLGHRDFNHREFPMSDSNFEYLRKLALENTGIELGEHKKEMVYSRIIRRLRTLQLPDFDSYCQYLDSHMSSEMTDFINSITTNLTSFFREDHHFSFIEKTLLPELRARPGGKRVRIWSAGCSTGEEPYSIAMTLLDAGVDNTWDARVTASDLDSNVVAHARAGIYLADSVKACGEQRMRLYFDAVANNPRQMQIRDRVKSLVAFQQLNLLSPWALPGSFDLIMCRNVVIYFSKDTQRRLFDRYAGMLTPNGYLIIGHSESLYGVSDRFRNLGKTIYQKVT